MRLPVEDVLPQLAAVLRSGTEAVLQAPPGAGKTTLVPPALLEESWLEDRRIVMLEPRRLAARAAARRIAALLGESVGETVGYRIRMDARVGPRTRIEVVTEGILTRMIQNDPSLDGIGTVIFDEYHERSLHADLGLTLCLESRTVFRPDLRLLVMSATLESNAVADLLGQAPILTAQGRMHPVDTHYLDQTATARFEDLAARTVRSALAEHAEGDLLVFLPGAAEIQRTRSRLRDVPADVVPLYGTLPQEDQDLAIQPSGDGRRKVVLSTDIAETSLTIEGVRIVIDGGKMRVPRFSPRSGMTRLATVPVSISSADQRRGRAGRLGPGTCYRLWTRLDHQHLEAHSAPEIVQADLAPLVLELARWGTTDPSTLRWMDPPPAAAYGQAQDLLQHLGALDRTGRITDHGRDMVELGLQPRLAHLVLSGRTLGLGGMACDIAALLSERDIFRADGPVADVDVRLRLQALTDVRRHGEPRLPYSRGFEVSVGACRRVTRLSNLWRRRIGAGAAENEADIEAAGILLAFAYPDRIAQRMPGHDGRFRLRNGRQALISEPQLISDAPFLVAADVGGAGGRSRIFRAAPVALDDLESFFGAEIDCERQVRWESGVVRAREQHRLGAVVLRDAPLRNPDPEEMVEAVLYGIRDEGLAILPWTRTARRLVERMQFMHLVDPDWPDASEPAQKASLDEWLRPHLYGIKRMEELQRLNLTDILLGSLTWEQRRELDERAPIHIEVPSGSRIPVDYSDPSAPVLSVRLQEMFGWTETPRIDRGRVSLTLHLLSPAHRPVQVTRDLESFWRETYFEVRKDLRGRYPKHYWPDDPLNAEPTHRTKPRM